MFNSISRTLFSISKSARRDVESALSKIKDNPTDEKATKEALKAIEETLHDRGTYRFSSRANRKITKILNEIEGKTGRSDTVKKASALVKARTVTYKKRISLLGELAHIAQEGAIDTNFAVGLARGVTEKDLVAILKKAIPADGEISQSFFDQFFNPLLNELEEIPDDLALSIIAKLPEELSDEKDALEPASQKFPNILKLATEVSLSKSGADKTLKMRMANIPPSQRDAFITYMDKQPDEIKSAFFGALAKASAYDYALLIKPPKKHTIPKEQFENVKTALSKFCATARSPEYSTTKTKNLCLALFNLIEDRLANADLIKHLSTQLKEEDKKTIAATIRKLYPAQHSNPEFFSFAHALADQIETKTT